MQSNYGSHRQKTGADPKEHDTCLEGLARNTRASTETVIADVFSVKC